MGLAVSVRGVNGFRLSRKRLYDSGDLRTKIAWCSPEVSVGSGCLAVPTRMGMSAEVSEGAQMAVTFTTSSFEVIAGNDAGIVIEDRKTGQSWRLSNQQAREFGRLIGRRRRLAEHLAANVSCKVPRAEA
jgi:hypothetical protein